MFDEMNPSSNHADRTRKFNITVQDLSHWAGLPVETVREELNKFAEKRRIEIYDNSIVVNNIVDMKRLVDQKSMMRQS